MARTVATGTDDPTAIDPERAGLADEGQVPDPQPHKTCSDGRVGPAESSRTPSRPVKKP